MSSDMITTTCFLVYVVVLLILFLLIYVFYNTTENVDEVAWWPQIVLSIFWPIGVIVGVPMFIIAFPFFIIGDWLVARNKKRDKSEAHHE